MTTRLAQRILDVMRRKRHPSWVYFAEGRLGPAQLLTHYTHAWALHHCGHSERLAQLLTQVPSGSEAQRVVASAVYDGLTGGLSPEATPHAALFLELMDALGLPRERFQRDDLMTPEAQRFRGFLDATSRGPWRAAAAVLLIFFEERPQHDDEAPAVNTPPDARIPPEHLEHIIARHPLVRWYNVPLTAMRAERVRLRDAPRRQAAAYRVVTEGAFDAEHPLIIGALEAALEHWLSYRQSIAKQWGVAR